MIIETSDVLDATGRKTATRVTLIDDYSRRYSADIAVGQDTPQAIDAVATKLQSQASGQMVAPSVTQQAEVQALQPADVATAIAGDASAEFPPSEG